MVAGAPGGSCRPEQCFPPFFFLGGGGEVERQFSFPQFPMEAPEGRFLQGNEEDQSVGTVTQQRVTRHRPEKLASLSSSAGDAGREEGGGEFPPSISITISRVEVGR